jgi:hypothetical protein
MALALGSSRLSARVLALHSSPMVVVLATAPPDPRSPPRLAPLVTALREQRQRQRQQQQQRQQEQRQQRRQRARPPSSSTATATPVVAAVPAHRWLRGRSKR